MDLKHEVLNNSRQTVANKNQVPTDLLVNFQDFPRPSLVVSITSSGNILQPPAGYLRSCAAVFRRFPVKSGFTLTLPFCCRPLQLFGLPGNFRLPIKACTSFQPIFPFNPNPVYHSDSRNLVDFILTQGNWIVNIIFSFLNK